MALSAPALLDAARAATGLDDFGDPSFRDGLAALLAALESEADLNAIGRMAHEAQLSGYLCERLRIEDWYRRHPEIAAPLDWLRARRREARMTGPGACVFDKFADEGEARAMQAELPEVMRGFVTRGLDRHPLHDWVN